MKDDYFCWLVGLIGDDYISMHYQKLLWKLYQTEYTWELDYDKNRASDGLYLRQMYVDQGGFWMDSGLREEGCSVLEMMIALSKRVENDIMYDPDYGDRSRVWFWTMLQNLGLDSYDDYNWFESEVDRILDVFLHRRYAKNGVGGAFPIRNQTRDLRKTDLWWQMNAYLEENYPV